MRERKPRVMVVFDGGFWRAAEVTFAQQTGPHIWTYTARSMGGGAFNTPEQALKQVRKKAKEHRKPKKEPTIDEVRTATSADHGHASGAA